MSKLTNTDWWLGRTDEQQARKQAARDGVTEARADYREKQQGRSSGLLAKASIGMFVFAVVLFAVSLLG